jgi:hypothetical protein
MRVVWFGDTGVPSRTPMLSVAGVADDTTVDVARTCATALGGALWPNTPNTFELVAKVPFGGDSATYDTTEINEYWAQASKEAYHVIDAPEAGFLKANTMHLEENVIMGTSGLYGEEMDDDDYPICFHPVSVETCVVDEGPNGRIDTVYFEYVMSARQIVEKYDKVAPAVRALYNSNKTEDRVKVIQAIQPRAGGKRGAKNDEKPYSSTHVDPTARLIMKESGIDDCPVWVSRFSQRPAEIYGRSLAMYALPTIKELNIIRRAYSFSLEKALDVPLGYYPEMLGGVTKVEAGPGARVPCYNSTRAPEGQKPIFELLNVQEPQKAGERIQELMAELRIKFLIDKLLDFNNESRMTLGEAKMRGDFRNQALGGVFGPQIIEVYHPLIKWVVRLLYRRRRLGLHPIKDMLKINQAKAEGKTVFVIPVAVAALMDNGKDAFTVRFISPAARAMKADSQYGLEQLINFCLTLHNAGVTDALDNIDTDASIKLAQDAYGAPLAALRSGDSKKKVRKMKADQLQEQMKMAMQEQGAVIQDKIAKANKNNSQAGIAPQQPMMNGQGIAPNAA